MACSHPEGEICALCGSTLNAETVLSPSGAPRAERDSLPPGTAIGRYLVLEPLGQGGMGVIYRAHDPQLQRVVAIKVLRSHRAEDGSSGQLRLLREAQAMAQLAHPNVVPVYDSGPFGNGIFIAMELVQGTTLDVWGRQRRGWREVLRVFIEAGRGLEAAHAKGLIHRDFKPANVLLGADGRPRVSDFGLARATRSSSSSSAVELQEPISESTTSGAFSLDQPLTQAGALMGSPGYMAPEQYAGGETSEATDQFSFCVALYEALLGVKPFTGKSLPEVAQATVRGVLPPVPKGAEVPRWLLRVVEKGLASHPADRHASMTALLAALSADPSRRRRVWSAVAAGALVLVGSGVSIWWWTGRARACVGTEDVVARVWSRDARARAEQAFLATGVNFAKPSWLMTRDALDGWAKAWAHARTDACEATRVRGEQTERQLTLRAECLDRRLVEFQSLVESFSRADKEMVARSTSAVTQLTPLSACANVKQLEDRRAPPPQLAEVAAQLSNELARSRGMALAGRMNDARPQLETIAQRASQLKLPALEAEARESLGALLLLDRDFVAARLEHERGVRAAEVAADDATAARLLARMVSLVGWRLRKPEEGRTWAALASGILERAGGDVETEARIEEGLGDVEWQAGNRGEALAAYRRSLALFRQSGGDDTLDVARLHSSIGWVLTEQGELDLAGKELDTSRVIREQQLGTEHPALADTWNELATLAVERRDYAQAVRCAEQSVRVSEGLARRNEVALLALAEMQIAAGRASDAAGFMERGRRPELVANSPSTAVELSRAHTLYLVRRGRVKEALEEGHATLQEQERQLGAQHPEVTLMADSLAEATFASGSWAETVALTDRYLTMKGALTRVDSPRTGESLLRTAQALLMLKRPADALPRAERALSALQKGVLERSLRGEARRVLAEALRGTGGDAGRVAELLREAEEDATASGDAALLQRLEKR